MANIRQMIDFANKPATVRIPDSMVIKSHLRGEILRHSAGKWRGSAHQTYTLEAKH